jgi:hypothetical protein
LAILTAPISLLALAHAPSLSVSGVLSEALKVPYMTSYSVVARAVSALMSVGIIYGVTKMAEEVGGRSAALWAAGVCAVNVVFTYYSQTSNLDVPYLFWATLALLELTRCIARGEAGRLRRSLAFAALAVTSKDQAFALFALGVPASLALAAILGAAPRPRRHSLWKEVAVAGLIFAVIVGIVDGAPFNPRGLLARMNYLTGPASAPYAYYSADAWGRVLALVDSVGHFDQFYPLAFAPLVLGGLVRAAAIPERRVRAAGLVPMWAALSYTLLFNCSARRTEHRFLMPQMVLWAVYAGLALEWIWHRRPGLGRATARTACVVAFGWALFRCVDVDMNLLRDPRYDTEQWLKEHVLAGDVLEVHGKSVYLPRLPPQARVVRVGPEPVGARNPVYGAEERQDALGNIAARAPRWVVVSEVSARPYLREAPGTDSASGRLLSQTEVRVGSDPDGRSFFRGLLDGRLRYRLVHVSTWKSSLWPRVDIHGSVSPEVWIFERTEG